MTETDRDQDVKTGTQDAENPAAKKAVTKKEKTAKHKRDGKAKSSKSVKSARSAGAAGHVKKAKKGRGKGKSTSQSISESFGHAFDGMVDGLEERNMKIHCTMAALVVFFGLVLHISVTEWCICIVLFGLIMGLELVNTALEAVVDLVTEEYHPLAKRAKDAAAGAVLIASIMAATAGLIIFIPRLLYVLRIL